MPAPRRRGPRFQPPGCARRSRCDSAHLWLIDLRARIPSTSSGSSWSACARDSSSWSRPFASLPASATASSSSRRSSLLFAVQHQLASFYSTDVLAQHRSRSAAGNHARRRATPVRISGRKRRGKGLSRCGPRHRDSETRPFVPAATSPTQPPRAPPQPPTGRIPCPEDLGAHSPIPCRTPCAPLIRNPPRRSLDAQGRTPAGGQQGPRHFFGFFAPCAARANNAKNCRRETSITTPDFASSLAGAPALHATHATQGTPQGRALRV